jgi:hypothetical protein
MTHDGRMARGEANHKAGVLLDNNDTLYFLENSTPDKPKPKSKKKEVDMEEEEKEEE